jgi:hypothetical protein
VTVRGNNTNPTTDSGFKIAQVADVAVTESPLIRPDIPSRDRAPSPPPAATAAETSLATPFGVVDDIFMFDPNQSIYFLDVLTNDWLGDSHSFRILEFGQGICDGKLRIQGDRFEYRPSPNASGMEWFTYTLRDDLGRTGSARVTLFLTFPQELENGITIGGDEQFGPNE